MINDKIYNFSKENFKIELTLIPTIRIQYIKYIIQNTLYRIISHQFSLIFIRILLDIDSWLLLKFNKLCI